MAQKSPWGGRFEQAMHPVVVSFNQSVSFDKILAPFDIDGSKAHAKMLAKVGLISGSEAQQILDGLDAIRADIDAGQFVWKAELEDVHMNIETALKERIGAPAGKLHTARSRNDQIALDMRLWMRDAIDKLLDALRNACGVLSEKALEYADAVMPGYTHLQRAMPVTAGHHLLAYVESFARDRERLGDCRRRVNRMPLGSAALAGTALPIDRQFVADQLGFDSLCMNSMDGVAARDHFIEFASCLSTLAIHLSRFSEDAIFWHSIEARFAVVGEAFRTGSSIMPQKINPDVFELIRGKSASIAAALVQLLLLVKSQPMTYNKDLQEDKPLLFRATADALDCLTVFAPMISTLTFDRAKLLAACEGGFMDAISVADVLVKKGVPFRDAHEVSGRLVKLAESRGCELKDLTEKDYSAAHPSLDSSLRVSLGAAGMASAYQSEGSANPYKVRAEAERWLAFFSEGQL
ncbi:MAG: argininosuccinate lyase [Planctomycetota bacterium]